MEILFRGKRVDNNEWMYGDLIQKKDGTRQIYSEKELDGYKETFFDIFKVIPETVGQFTGQIDKNGTKIFDGDIVKMKWHRLELVGKIKNGKYNHSKCDEYDCSRYGWHIDCKWQNYCCNTGFDLFEENTEIKVISNTHKKEVE